MLALIPARGGSKGLRKKNIKNLNGKPLIAYTIQVAKKSSNIDDIIVSTDDKEIAEISEEYGAKVPFLRPEKLASDTAKAIDTYIYTVDRLNEDKKNKIKEFLILLPTAPLRTTSDVDGAINLFYKKNADSVISVTEADYPPYWTKTITDKGLLRSYFVGRKVTDFANENRQEFTTAYVPNGAVYIFKLDLLKEKYSYYSENTYAYIMPKIRSVDIDTVYDFEYAEFLLRRKHEKL